MFYRLFVIKICFFLYTSTLSAQQSFGNLQQATQICNQKHNVLVNDQCEAKYVWINQENVKILSQPNGSEKGEAVYLKTYARSTFSKKGYVELIEKEDLIRDKQSEKLLGYRPLGWVKEDTLLTHKFPMSERRSQINLKALVVNQVKDGSSVEELVAAPIYKGPDKKKFSKRQTPLRTRSVFYVYDHDGPKISNNGKDSYLSEEVKYLLVGKKPIIVDAKPTARDTILGWIEKERVRFWNTRDGIQFNKSTRDKRLAVNTHGAAIYEAGLYASMHSKRKIIAYEPMHELTHASIRNPVLNSLNNVKNANTTGRVYQIGIFGGLGEEVSIEELDRLRTEMQDRNFGLEIIFVIDATRSMKPYFSKVKNATQSIIRQINKQTREKLLPEDTPPKFGINFYRDYPNRSANLPFDYCKKVTYPILPATSAQQILSELDAHQACDADSDQEEAVYEGILKALDFPETPDYQRVIILIGDAGNHFPNQSSSNNRTMQEVIEKVKKKNVFLYSILVGEQNNRASRLFKKQFETLTQQLITNQSISNVSQEGYSAKFVESNLFKAEEFIFSLLQRSVKFQEELKEVAEHVTIAGTVDGVTGYYHPDVIGNFIKKLSPRDRRIIQSKKVQLFTEGWVAEKDKQGFRQIEEVLFIDKRTFNKMQYLLNDLIFTASQKKFIQVWAQKISEHTGDDCNTRRLQDCIQKSTGIPFNHIGLLKYTLSEIKKLTRSGDKYLDLICDMKVAFERMNLIANDRAGEVKKGLDSTGECIAIVEHARGQRYWFSYGGAKTAWLRLSDLP